MITEEQKKKLFIPRKIDERDKLFLKEIGMGPVINFLIDKNTDINFDFSTSPDQWDWYCHDISFGFDMKSLPEFEEPIKNIILNIAETISGVYHIWGSISISLDNELRVSYDYEITKMENGSKVYKL